MTDSDPLPEAYIVGSRVKVVDYVFAANFTVYVYDWLLSLPDELEVVSRSGLTMSITIYFLSRISVVSHMCFLAVSLSALAPVENCAILGKMLGACAVVSTASTSFLFFLRVRAVYLRSRYVTALFGTLWIVTISLTIWTNGKISAEHHLSPAANIICITTGLEVFYLPVALTFANDTLIFLAISYRLAANAVTDGTRRSRLLTIVKGKGLYTLSQSMLLGGQLYYFSTLLYLLVNFAILWILSVHPGPILITVHMGFTSIMACRIFRGVALGMIHIEPLPNGLTSTAIANAFQLGAITSHRDPTLNIAGVSAP